MPPNFKNQGQLLLVRSLIQLWLELPALSPGLLRPASSYSASASAASLIQLEIRLRLASLSLFGGGRPDESPIILNQANCALSNNVWLVVFS